MWKLLPSLLSSWLVSTWRRAVNAGAMWAAIASSLVLAVALLAWLVAALPRRFTQLPPILCRNTTRQRAGVSVRTLVVLGSGTLAAAFSGLLPATPSRLSFNVVSRSLCSLFTSRRPHWRDDATASIAGAAVGWG